MPTPTYTPTYTLDGQPYTGPVVFARLQHAMPTDWHGHPLDVVPMNPLHAATLYEFVDRGGVPILWEPQTGGNIGTLYVGQAGPGGNYLAAIGPFDGATCDPLDVDCVHVSRDDGVAFDTHCTSIPEVLRALGDLVHISPAYRWVFGALAMYADWEFGGQCSPSPDDLGRWWVEIHGAADGDVTGASATAAGDYVYVHEQDGEDLVTIATAMATGAHWRVEACPECGTRAGDCFCATADDAVRGQ